MNGAFFGDNFYGPSESQVEETNAYGEILNDGIQAEATTLVMLLRRSGLKAHLWPPMRQSRSSPCPHGTNWLVYVVTSMKPG